MPSLQANHHPHTTSLSEAGDCDVDHHVNNNNNNYNYYNYKGILLQCRRKLQEHLTTEKIQPTTESRRIRTEVRQSEIKQAAEEQCLQRSFEGDLQQ